MSGSKGAASAASATGATGAQGVKGDKGDVGSSATATPLSDAAPLALGTAAAGVSASASRGDHVHPLPAGRLALMGTATIGETTIISLSLGVKRYTVAMAGAAVGDRAVAVLTGAPQNGSLQDVYVPSAGNINVGVLAPALGIGQVIAVPVAFYKVT